jgi:KRAB domain-containing zinc finger protein
MEFFIMKQYTISLFFLSIIAPQFTHAMENLEFKSPSYDSDFFMTLEENNFFDNQSAGYTDFFTDMENNNESISIVEKVDPLKQTLPVVQAALNSLEKKEFKCRFCDKTYQNNSGLTIHERNHTGERPFVCDVKGCNKTFTSNNSLKNHKPTHQSNFVTCSDCGKTFANRSELLQHKDIHTREKFFSRSFLSYNDKIANESSVQKENVVPDTNEKKLYQDNQCQYCNELLSTKKNLERHIIAIHTQEKSYQCLYCNKSFSREDVLEKHTRVHTGEKPYQCPYCPKACADISDLNKHKRTHTGEKPYVCKVPGCNEAYANTASLTYHMKKKHNPDCLNKNSSPITPHNTPSQVSTDYLLASTTQATDNYLNNNTMQEPYPHQCNYCHQSFSRKNNLERHIRTHTGEKPYQCKYCSITYTDQSDLKKHERTHTREKPYVCIIPGCNKEYVNSHSLTSHMKKKHNPDCLNKNSSPITPHNTSSQVPTNYLPASTTQVIDNYLNNNTMQEQYPLYYYYNALSINMQNMQKY